MVMVALAVVIHLALTPVLGSKEPQYILSQLILKFSELSIHVLIPILRQEN